MDFVIDFVFTTPATIGGSRRSSRCCWPSGHVRPTRERLRAQLAIEAEYDRGTGRLELITFDSDHNGTVDTWSPRPLSSGSPPAGGAP